jgi:hypothetical protein
MSQAFQSTHFQSLLPSSWKDIRTFLAQEGYVPTLVGGTVRDFLLNGKMGQDWDVELSHPTLSFNKDAWKNLGKDLTRFGKVTFLSYEIIRLDAKSVQYEFSPPRREIFQENWQEAGHSNFTAEFDLKLPFAQAIKRRDFTINAMGVKFLSGKEHEFMDPAGGLVHLRDKLLHYCGEDFQKDPVRFVRALRFAQKMQFQFTPELEHLLKTMPVGSITPSYIWNELQKSGNALALLRTLLKWQGQKPQLNLPVLASELEGKWEELSRMLTDQSRHESFVIALEWVGISSVSWQKFFSLGSETCQRLGRWAIHSRRFTSIPPEKFHGEFDEVREIAEFETLFDWYFTTKQLLQKNPSLPLLEMIAQYLPDWVHLYRFEPVKDVRHIDPPLRAKYQVWNLCQRL